MMWPYMPGRLTATPRPEAQRTEAPACAQRRWCWTALLVPLILTLAGAAQAQDPAPTVPSFFLEAIEVENATNVSAEIVVAESLLKSGHSYTEDQLRDAVHRVVRLPFVLDADFALRKGQVRDQYALVITIAETHTWFSGADFGYWTPRSGSSFQWGSQATVSNLTVGKRFFVGRHGEFFAAIGGVDNSTSLSEDFAALSVGYNHYDLFGKGAILSVGYGLRNLSSFGRSHEISGRLGIPLQANQSIELSTGYSWFDQQSRAAAFGLFESTGFSSKAAWIYNSLDDPALPTRGWLIEASSQYWDTETRTALTLPEGVTTGQAQANSFRLGLSAQHFWPISPRQSVSAQASAGFATFDGTSYFEGEPQPQNLPSEQWLGTAEIGYQLLLIDRRQQERWRQLRWETAVRYREHETDLFSNRFDPGKGWSASTGLVFRTGWGVYRLSFSYNSVNRMAPL